MERTTYIRSIPEEGKNCISRGYKKGPEKTFPLRITQSYHYTLPKVIQTLIVRGANPRQRNNRGETSTDTVRIYGGQDKDNRDRIITLMNKYVLKNKQ